MPCHEKFECFNNPQALPHAGACNAHDQAIWAIKGSSIKTVHETMWLRVLATSYAMQMIMPSHDVQMHMHVVSVASEPGKYDIVPYSCGTAHADAV